MLKSVKKDNKQQDLAVKKQRKCLLMPKRVPKHTQILEQAFVKILSTEANILC